MNPGKFRYVIFVTTAMWKLKLLSGILILLSLLTSSCSPSGEKPKLPDSTKGFNMQNADSSLNGSYTGLEYTGTQTDPAYPGKLFKTYHLGDLKIIGDSAFLDQNPISIYKKDTLYSASDGGFYYYSGTVQRKDTTITIDLKELFCDYCPVPAPRKKPDGTMGVMRRTKQLKGHLTKKGFILNGCLYARNINEKSLLSENPEPYIEKLKQ